MIIKWTVLVLLLLGSLALFGCATVPPDPMPPPPTEPPAMDLTKPYGKMVNPETGKLVCSSKSVLEYQGLCYPYEAAERACAGSLRYYIPQDCGHAGFPDGR